MNKPKQQTVAPLQIAIQHHQAGRLEQAEAIYKKIHNNSDALNLQGAIAYQTGKNDKAIDFFKKALRLKPSDASYYYNLGLAYRALNKLDEAVDAYRQAIALRPAYLDAYNNLGVLFQDQGKLDETIACYQKVLALNPDHAGILANMGAALKSQGKLDEAISCCRRALAVEPNNLNAHNNLGSALEDKGELEAANACFQSALAIQPDCSEAHYNLGNVLKTQEKIDDAIACFRRALDINPHFAAAHNSLGISLLKQGKLEQALASFQRAIQANPGFAADCYNNMGCVLLNHGKLDEAITCFRQAIQAKPDFATAHSNMLFAHNYHPTLSAEQIFAAYRQWNEQQAAHFSRDLPAFANRPDPQRKLRIGYISPDFNDHSVIRFAGPLVQQYDKSSFEVYCYYNRFYFDQQTVEVMAATDYWVLCQGMTDDQLAQRIREDGIDILVDLAGHTGANRLLVFARKPAPIQVSWLGFGYTTGLSAMDYFIGDPVFTPPGSEALFSETIYRLPHAAWTYQPPPTAPEPGPLPAQRNGYVTFACLSRSERINEPMIAAWAAILRRLPSARLRLDSKNFGDAVLRSDIEAKFATHGIAAEQLQIGYTSPVWSIYRDSDIVLDCFPHNSGTTTYEALWMGIPVLTLAARPSVGRLGASILSCIGHPEWIATDSDDYIERAVALAQDVAGLAGIRAALRESMRASPLLDQKTFVRNMETAYRDMWQTWCARQPKASESSFETALQHHQAGRLQQADAIYQTLPDNPNAVHLRGVIALQSGQPQLAVERISQAIAAEPNNPAYYCDLGSAYHALKKLDEAAASYQKALVLNPNYPLAHNNLGNTLKNMGQPEAAAASYRKALVLIPNYAEAHNNLGSALKDLERTDEAIDCYRKALALKPDFSEAHFNLGNALYTQVKLGDAVASFHAALALKPDFYLARNNLGLVFKDQGKLDQAMDCFQQTLAIKPDYADAHSNLLFCHNYHPAFSAQQIFSAYQHWNTQQAAQYSQDIAPFANPRDPQRRLKIGYVSADFFNHSVIRFAGPVIERHDKKQFEVFCYSNRMRHDAFTDRIMAAADHWIPCQGMTDAQLAQRIRADGIDILLDLSGHTAGHRLLAFARKPAPVQASWLGFGYTTGLRAMDYFIGDPVFTPAGAQALFSERILRLPHCFAVYQPPEAAPAPGALPARRNGYVTFACLSRSERVNARVIEAWATILRRLPHARLRLDSKNFSDKDLRSDIEARFAALGIPATRLDIGFTAPVWQVYQEIDIVLDCFPHNSGTTTYEALWMGVPVVTLAERPSVGRIGASILSCVGKPEWIAGDSADYVERALALAQDLTALEATRATLRQAMCDSPLLDRAGFVRDIEVAYRDMWQAWCGGIPHGEARLTAGSAAASPDAPPADALPRCAVPPAAAASVPGADPAAAILATALEHHRAGRLQQAAALYQSLPGHPDALHLQGVVALQGGQYAAATALIGQAIAIDPAKAAYHCDLGGACFGLRQYAQAAACYRQALALQPDYALAHNNLGNACQALGQLEDAVACYRRALALQPDYAEAHLNLGSAHKELGCLDDAATSYRQALAIHPDFADAHYNLGNTLAAQGQLQQAIACFQDALKLKPALHAARINLGTALERLNRLEEATACYLRALELDPQLVEANDKLGTVLLQLGQYDEAAVFLQRALAGKPDAAETHSNFGLALLRQGKLGAAAASLQRALELRPGYAEARSNLGTLLLNQCQPDEALAAFRLALQQAPDLSIAHSNLLFACNYHPTMAAEDIFAAYRAWNELQMARYSACAKPFANARAPQRRLKIGYLSPDFNHHSVIHFVTPLIEGHDKSRVELHCYYNRLRQDAGTARVMAAADHFTACQSLSDDDLAQQIRADGIDILVDLAGHTEGNRLPVFARKPAPVQVSWLGFGYTTGLSAMDYFIGDPAFTPPGCETLFSETIYRLPRVAWTYQPPAAAPEPGPLPARARGYVTFGCTARSERINAPMIAAWAELLRRVPDARLRLDSRNFADAALRQRMEQQFAAHGVPPQRLELGYSSPVWEVYRALDIILDCFPHNSGTTTFEALWMGLPVVTLAGRPSVGRLGASILTSLGRPQWIGADSAGYVACAVALARDIDALERERATLREAMRASPLLDHAGFARDMESAYRRMWEHWCAGRQPIAADAAAAHAAQ